MSELPNPETDFTHRINAVPEVGRTITFTTPTGATLVADVCEPAPNDSVWAGIGDQVRLRVAEGVTKGVVLLPSKSMVTWRYTLPRSLGGAS